jgi:hypothetical protein
LRPARTGWLSIQKRSAAEVSFGFPAFAGKPARTPPPTLLFLPIHLSKNTMGSPIVRPTRALTLFGRAEEDSPERIDPHDLRAIFTRPIAEPQSSTALVVEAYIGGPLRHCQHLVTKKRRLVERSGPRTASGSPAFLPRALFAPKIGRVWRHAGCVAAVDGAGPRRQVPRRPSAPSRRASADRGDERRS